MGGLPSFRTLTDGTKMRRLDGSMQSSDIRQRWYQIALITSINFRGVTEGMHFKEKLKNKIITQSKIVGNKTNIILHRIFLKNTYSSLEKRIHEISGRPVIIVGASPSAVELERFFKSRKVSSKYVIIGCNWTNFLDIKVDFFVSSYYLFCQFAKQSGRVDWVLHASPSPSVRNKSIVPIKRLNFGNNPERVLKSYVSKVGGCLYTNQNVLFLMLSLAHSIGPSSITLCGFESLSADPAGMHFFTNSKKRLDFMMDELIKIDNFRRSSKESGGDAAKELLSIIYRYFWCERNTSQDNWKLSREMNPYEVTQLAKKREVHLNGYLQAAESKCIPHYRIGKTTLFSNFPLNNDFK